MKTSLTFYKPIMIRPVSAVHTGSMFGDGVYFADNAIEINWLHIVKRFILNKVH
jgi:hypothetical protein